MGTFHAVDDGESGRNGCSLPYLSLVPYSGIDGAADQRAYLGAQRRNNACVRRHADDNDLSFSRWDRSATGSIVNGSVQIAVPCYFFAPRAGGVTISV